MPDIHLNHIHSILKGERMAKTIDEIVTSMIGQFVMQNAKLQAYVEAVQEQLIAKDVEIAHLKGPTLVSSKQAGQLPLPFDTT